MIYHPERLQGCAAPLIHLFERVGEQYDILALQGPRTIQEEQAAILAGTSKLRDPRESLHVIDPVKRPFALAGDVGPYPLDWKDERRFHHLAGYVLARADDLHVPMRWGGMWNGRLQWNRPGMLNDLVHYELTT